MRTWCGAQNEFLIDRKRKRFFAKTVCVQLKEGGAVMKIVPVNCTTYTTCGEFKESTFCIFYYTTMVKLDFFSYGKTIVIIIIILL